MESRDLYQILFDQNNVQSTHHAETMRELGRMNEQIASILVEAKKTNGRMTKAEGDIAQLKDSKNRIIGGAAVVTVVITAVWQLVAGK